MFKANDIGRAHLFYFIDQNDIAESNLRDGLRNFPELVFYKLCIDYTNNTFQ